MMRKVRLGAVVAALVVAGCSGDSAIPLADSGVDRAVPDSARVDSARPDMAGPYTLALFDRVRINSRGSIHLRKADTTLTLDRGPYKKVTLQVALESSCYPFSKWKSNPPPTGQNWPADCDAFDRNFEFLMDPPRNSSDPPALEWVRAITPFGGPMTFTVDLTDIANGAPGSHRVRVTLSTYSDGAGKVSGSNGGWWVTAKVHAEPGAAPRKVLAVKSLFNQSVKSTSGKQQTKLTVPAGTVSSRVEYRATGHGGGKSDAACIGPAEEFCQRWHRITVDGKEVKKVAPWRTDCAKGCTLATRGSMTYCKENPCGLIASVKASRANWCPGSVTPPMVWSFPALSTPGEHTFGYAIEKIASGGLWRVSVTYIAYGK